MNSGHHPEDTPAPAAGARARADDRLTLIVRDLVLDCHIGVSDGERGRPQRLRFNLEVEVTPPTAYDDDISGIVDYGALVRRVKATVDESQVLLLETLCDRILEDCLTDSRVLAGRLRIEKLDRYSNVGGLGIELERRRHPS